LLAIALLILLLPACSATIVPPPQPSDPVTVVLLDHGRHSSLVLPDAAGGALRYSYGDWDYYVLRQTDLASGARALLRGTPAALGRQQLAVAPESDSLLRALHVEVIQAWRLEVERARVARLRDDLEHQFNSALDTRVYSPWFGVDFVQHPAPYTLNHNSNHVVGVWLTELGCEIRGQPTLSSWTVRLPSGN
jgi:hypothetical protein